MEKTTLGGIPVRHLKITKQFGFSIIIGELKDENGRWTSLQAKWKLDGTWAGGAGKLDLKLEDIPERYPERFTPRFSVRTNQKNSVEELY